MPAERPNILLIMADQLAAQALPIYGHPIVQTPHLEALAAEGVVFDSAYCNSPLCAPSRASLMTGQLPSRIGVYDNAAELSAETPTFAHYLRALGYRTCLVGKMHFVGPDQLHGFEERLTTDIYPSDFGWTPDWEHPDERPSWYHNMLSVTEAGTCETSNQLDFDEEVAFHARHEIFQIARDDDPRPFLLTVSFTHPHDPFAITPRYWNRYDHAAIEPPVVPPLPARALDPHSRRLRHVCAMDEQPIDDEQARRARHAYYGMISYVDDRVGDLLHALDVTGLRENTIVIFTSDHGEMLGERGLWYKMNFFEWSARVPLIVHAPRWWSAGRRPEHVSLVDLLPTLLAIAGGRHDDLAAAIDGRSLLPLLRNSPEAAEATVYAEYLAEGALAPCLMVRRGRWKFIRSEPDPDLLYDLERDPHELENLAERPEYADVRDTFREEVTRRWNPPLLHARVLESQRRRAMIADALMTGHHTAWDFQPVQDASRQYMRNHLDLNELERRARFPAPGRGPEPRAPQADP
jgi:choline-sulfatase